jgi:hypothetical protein
LRTRIGNDAKDGAAHIANINKTRGDAGARSGKESVAARQAYAAHACETVAIGIPANLELRLPRIHEAADHVAKRGCSRIFLRRTSEENVT